MKNFRIDLNAMLPFPISEMASSVVMYRYRNTKGICGWYRCDYEEIGQMIHNAVFFESLYWLDVKFQVRDSEGNFSYRSWRFVEGRNGKHYWYDGDNAKWYQA